MYEFLSAAKVNSKEQKLNVFKTQMILRMSNDCIREVVLEDMLKLAK